MKSATIRSTFIDFFKSKGHVFVPSAPVVPENDPTLLFTNAGMNQFKPIFLGDQPPSFNRAVNAQPCIRVSGKHNDLEDVGYDTYHHTSFEMLGNWSFGDYYKKEAIEWAWELLTDVYGLPKDRLYATVFEDDDEAHDLWVSCTDILPNHVVRCGKKDNFWEMGSTGPCGPCSEIHLDLIPDMGPEIIRDTETGGLSNRYMELWNLVFIQYDRQANGDLVSLPACHVDTGAGLERLAAQLQGVSSNYDTDCFKPIINQVVRHLNVPIVDDKSAVPHRVIADHIRTVVFGISDNVRPSNEGRGYVLRRLIRRALRMASQAGKNEPFLHQLVPVVDDSLGGHYPNISARQDYIMDMIKSEEVQFLKTVASGLTVFTSVVSELKAANQSQIAGDTAFKLYDTFGFPLDLTQVMAREHNLTVDNDGFEAAMDGQRQRSREARTNVMFDGKDESIEALSDFVGDVQAGVYVDAPGGGEARIPADASQRFGMAQHHTATHLLHQALREVVGESVQQAGSLVDVNRLRFDFTHHQAISADDIRTIEQNVNQWIAENHAVTITEEAIDDAKKRGAHAMFGEKYGDTVRVVDIPSISIELCGGNHVVQTGDLQAFKIVAESAVAAGTRRMEAIVGERRIARYNQGVKDALWLDYSKRLETVSEQAAKAGIALSAPCTPDQPMDVIEQALHELTIQSKAIEQALRKKHQGDAHGLLANTLAKSAPLQGGVGVGVFARLDAQPIPVLRQLADQIVNQVKDGVVVLVSNQNGAGHAVAKVSSSVMDTLTAKDLIQELTTITGGGGGGRDNMAQAGGLNEDQLDAGVAHMVKKYA